MENNNACVKCGSELQIDRRGCAVTYTCPNCGWSIATTEWESIDLDKTQYRIRLAEGTPICKKTLSLVSRLTGKNFIESKKVIENLGVIFTGRARDILEQKSKLSKEGLAFVIEPDFPY